MPSTQSGDSRFNHRLWFIDPEAHPPALMIPTVDLLAAAAQGGGGSKNDPSSRSGPTDPLFPSLLIPPNTALGTTSMSAHPAVASSVNHRIAWDKKNLMMSAGGGVGGAGGASGMNGILSDQDSSSAGGASFSSFLAARPRAVFRSLGAPCRNDNPSDAGGIVGANPTFSAVKDKSSVLVGMKKNSSGAMLAASGLADAMYLRGLWVETGLPSPYVVDSNDDQ